MDEENLKVILYIEVPKDTLDSAIPSRAAIQAAFEHFISERGWFLHSFGTRPDQTFKDTREQEKKQDRDQAA